MHKRTCTTDGCNNPHKARGLCGTCYNRQLPNRHPKTTKPCDSCGMEVVKERRAQRYTNTFCSLDCRDYYRHGRSSTLPDDHWARNFGATCKWTPPDIRPLLAFDCSWCGAAFTSNQPASRYCSDRCTKRRHRAKRRAMEREAEGEFTWSQVARLWLAFGKACAYCRKPTPLDEIQAEHVIPLSRGGNNDLGNILPSCGPCNRDKRDLFIPDWQADRARRGKPALFTTWSPVDPLYAHLRAPAAA